MGGMNPLMTYMLTRGNDDRRDDGRDGRIDNRFRDKDGREHYDNGRFAPMRSEYDGGMVGMYGNIHTPMSGGMDYRYTPTRSNYDRPSMGYTEPIRTGGDDDDDYRRKWTITENNAYMEPEYNRDGMRRVMGFGGTSYVDHSRMDEMSHRSGKKMPGHAAVSYTPKLTYDTAQEWMSKLKNADGSKGPHWTFDEVKNLMQSRGVQGDPLVIWVGMNAEYSDAVMLNRKYGVDRPEYYLDAAVARWMNDKDAVDDKAAAYYMHVVKH